MIHSTCTLNCLARPPNRFVGSETKRNKPIRTEPNRIDSNRQVMDRIQPGVVVWKRVNIAPKNRFKKVENGNYVIEIAKVGGLKKLVE